MQMSKLYIILATIYIAPNVDVDWAYTIGGAFIALSLTSFFMERK